MLIERKVRVEFGRIWDSAAGPIRKARRFLALSSRLSSLASHLAHLGFTVQAEAQPGGRKLFWASAAEVLHFAQQARDHAREALRGENPKLGFDYGPQAYATPGWSEAKEPVPAPSEVVK